MKLFWKDFAHRGLLAAAGGPVILAIVYWALGNTGEIVSLTPGEVAFGILTVTALAFIAGGVSAVYKLERLGLLWATLIHATVLYLDYILIYLLNGWLRAAPTDILIFTGIFAMGFVVIWLCIYGTVRANVKRMNQRLHN